MIQNAEANQAKIMTVPKGFYFRLNFRHLIPTGGVWTIFFLVQWEWENFGAEARSDSDFYIFEKQISICTSREMDKHLKRSKLQNVDKIKYTLTVVRKSSLYFFVLSISIVVNYGLLLI